MSERRHHTYKIELEGPDFTALLQLVMRYGTGTGEGAGTAITLRQALARAQVINTHICDHEPKKPESEFLK
jgi:hypothetical protein